MKLPFIPSSKKLLVLILILILVLLSILGAYSYLNKPREKRGEPQPFSFKACPVPEEYCLDYREAKEGGSVAGIGYILPEGTNIYSVVRGAASFGSASLPGEQVRTVQVTRPELGYIVRYFFSGTAISDSLFEVPAGALLGQALEPMKTYNGLSLVIEIRDSESGEAVLFSGDDLFLNLR